MAITAAAFRKHLFGMTVVSFTALTAVIGSASQARADIIEDTAGFFGGIVGSVFGAPTGAAVSTLGDAPRAMYNKDAGAWEVIKDNTKAAARGNHNKNVVQQTTTAKPADKKAPAKAAKPTSKQDAAGRTQDQMYLDAQAARAAGNADPIVEKPYTYGATAGGAVTYVGGGVIGGGVGTIAGAGKGFVQGLFDSNMPVIGAVPGLFTGAWDGMLTGAKVGSTGTDGFPSFGFSSSGSAEVQPAAGATDKPIDIHPPKAKPASAKAKVAPPATATAPAPGKVTPKKAEPKSTYTTEQLPPPAAPAAGEAVKPAPQGPATQAPADAKPAAPQGAAPAATAPATTTADPAAPQLSGTPGDASVAPAKPVAGEPSKNGDVPVLGETTMTSAPAAAANDAKPADEVKTTAPAEAQPATTEDEWSPSKFLSNAAEAASGWTASPRTFALGTGAALLLLCGVALYAVHRFRNKAKNESAVKRSFAINKTIVTEKASAAWDKLTGLVARKPGAFSQKSGSSDQMPDTMMSDLAQELAALREERAAWQDAVADQKKQFEEQKRLMEDLIRQIETLKEEKAALAEENARYVRTMTSVTESMRETKKAFDNAMSVRRDEVVIPAAAVAEEPAKPVAAVDFSKPVSATAAGPVAVVDPDVGFDVTEAIEEAVIVATGGTPVVAEESSKPAAAGGTGPSSFRQRADAANEGKPHHRGPGGGGKPSAPHGKPVRSKVTTSKRVRGYAPR